MATHHHSDFSDDEESIRIIPGIPVRRPTNPSEGPIEHSRKINLNAQQDRNYVGNSISTAKYSLLCFLPSFLFEQFRRYSNIFFLTIALLQQIPDVSPTGKFTTLVPLICILSVSAIKEIIEDVKRHKADRETNLKEVEVLKGGEWKWVKWNSVCVGDFVKVRNDKFFPADLVLLSSSENQGICYIETSNLDGETNLKIRQAILETSHLLEAHDLARLKGFLECEPPNRNLYEFVGRLKLHDEPQDFALGPDQILLRGGKLQNTSFIHGIAIYTGHESKMMKNSTVAPLKRSTVDKRTNTQIIFLLMLLIVIAVTCSIFSVFLVDQDEMSKYLPDLAESESSAGKKALMFLYSVLTFVILFNNLIPISLTVTLEVVRFIQALFINWDLEMYCQETNTPAMARTSNLNEELGDVSYVFSDKTGTLTRNIMEFKACSVAGKMYKPEDLLEGKRNLLLEDMSSSSDAHVKSNIREFLTLLAICHTVIPDYSNGPGIENVMYHAQSPDERALVYAALKMGFAFIKRTPNHVTVNILGTEEKFHILHVLEFSSARKRMSVIVKGSDGKLKLYCKGADSMILERMANADGPVTKMTEKHLEEFSKQGLRTLCCAVTDVQPKFYEEWKKTFHKAATALHDREGQMDDAAEQIEKDLRLVGSTAIEDKLQDEVPETIAALMEAGIRVWVLTGDKQETAINIGHSCRLLTSQMELFLVNRDTEKETMDCLKEYEKKVHHVVGEHRAEAAVIIDGKTLKFALEPTLRSMFLELCCKCKAVIVCRASPIQKAEIVQYVTERTGAITLAIGDGQNDVCMIQKAHVGIGISGQEGLQAACASDYAIAQFRFLKKLLFVHGAWNYDRMCKLIFYSYYKNICLYIIELWFAIYSAWSGQIIFERWTIGLYNMLFTCAQPIAIGLFERNCSQDLRLRYPILYKPSRNTFSLKMFFVWILDSLVHSIIIFWFTWHLYGEGVVWSSGTDGGEGGHQGGYLVVGNFIYTYVVVIVSLKSGLITKSWTIFTHLSIWGSILLWFLFLYAYGNLYRLRLPGNLGAEIFGIDYMVYTSPMFWIGLMIVPIAALLPDLVVKAFETTMFQNIDDAFRECEAMKKDPELMLKTRGKQKLHENNTDCLDNLEDIYRACLSCDSAELKHRCCLCLQRSKTSPTTTEEAAAEEDPSVSVASTDQSKSDVSTTNTAKRSLKAAALKASNLLKSATKSKSKPSK